MNASYPHVVNPFELTLQVDIAASKKRRGAARWPVLMCAIVALGAGAAAFTEGPAADHPTLRPYASALRGRAIRAADVTTRFVHDVVAR